MTPSSAPTRRGRPRKRATDIGAEERILDSAEELFAGHGFHGVTLREIARAAGVDPSLPVYYFADKRTLFEAVFDRRAALLNRERLDALNDYERQMGAEMTVEGCIEAFLRPVFSWSMRGGPGWKHYFAITAQVNNTPLWGGETMGRHFDPVVQRLIGLLRKVLPHADDVDLYWGYHQLSGALTLSMSETGRIDRLSGGLCRSGDLASLLQRMIAYSAAGFRAVASKPDGSGFAASPPS